MNSLPSLRPIFIQFGALAIALVVGSTGAIAATAQINAGTFVMLPLVAGDTGVPYQVFASKAERTTYGDAIARGIRARDGGTRVANSRVAKALATAGIDQESPYRACNDAACAREIGRAVHADTVVYGSVTRALSMIWGSEVSIVDVATGHVEGPYDLGYKGDFLTLETGVDVLAQVVSNRLIADASARSRARAMARR
jgi:hypothetical protein